MLSTIRERQSSEEVLLDRETGEEVGEDLEGEVMRKGEG